MGGRGSSSATNASSAYNKLNRQITKNYNKSIEELRSKYTEEFAKISGGTQQQYRSLVRYSQNQGFDVVEKDLTSISPDLHGRTSFRDKEIYIKSSLTQPQKIKTLAHEIGHATLHKGNSRNDLGKVEAEAEAFAKLTTDKFGIINDSSKYYIPGWMKREGTSVSDFSTYKDRVIEAFSQMTKFLGL